MIARLLCKLGLHRWRFVETIDARMIGGDVRHVETIHARCCRGVGCRYSEWDIVNSQVVGKETL